MQEITKLICQKNRVSYLLFDKSYKVVEFSPHIDDFFMQCEGLKEGVDAREFLWELVGLEEELQKKNIHFPMILKAKKYFDLDIETFFSDKGEKLFIAYITEMPNETLQYTHVLQKINQKTLIYEQEEREKKELQYELINKKFLQFNVNLDGFITSINCVFSYFFHIDETKAIGKHFSTFFQTRAEEIQNDQESIIFNAYNQNRELISFHVTRIPLIQEKKVYENIIICQDINYLKNIEKELRFVSEYDALTGIPNKTLFLKKVDYRLSLEKKASTAFEIFYINILHFTTLNDAYGYHAGDMMLKHIAELLKHFTRKEDLVSRVGGDRFALLFYAKKSAIDRKRIFQKLHALTKNNALVYTSEDIIEFSFQIGSASYPDNGVTSQELLLYASKNLS